MLSTNRKRREQKRLNKFGTPTPRCELCGENGMPSLTTITLLERHHIPGHHEGETIIVCQNCHTKLTDTQLEWPKELFSDNRSDVTKAVAFFMGLSAILALLASLCGKHAMAIYNYTISTAEKRAELK